MIKKKLDYIFLKVYYILKKLKLHYLKDFLFINIFKRNSYKTQENILLKKNKAIYFHISKVAGTSIKKTICKILEIDTKGFEKEDYHHVDYPCVHKSEINTKYKDYYKFAFVRNPFDRLVSCYENRILKEEKDFGPYVKGVNGHFLSIGKFYAGMSFNDFIKEVSQIKDKDSDDHFRSQFDVLTDKKGNLLVNKVFKFENLESDFRKVLKDIGIKKEIKLPYLMKSNHNQYQKYYDDETRDLVENRFKKDLETFDYKF